MVKMNKIFPFIEMPLNTSLFIEMRGITKIYLNRVLALIDVDFDLKPCEVHCILGENGAGKSTLMKILAGVLKPTKGEILINGKHVVFNSPSDAQKYGIGMVHQSFNLVEDISAIDNVLLSLPLSIRKKLWVNRRKFAIDFRQFSESVGLPIDPFIKVKHLSAGLKQRLEILRLLYLGATILIFDEPTSMLTPIETEELFKFVNNIKGQGSSIVWITHRLNEVNRVCDRVTILRKGKVVRCFTEEDMRKGVELTELAHYMVGEDSLDYFNKVKYHSIQLQLSEPILRIENVIIRDDYGGIKIKNASLNLYKGEILGIAGVSGNGQKELVEGIVGYRAIERGKIIFDGKDITSRSISERLKMGIAYIPADRLERGIAEELSIVENIYMYWSNSVDSFRKVHLLDIGSLYDRAINLIKEYNIKVLDPLFPAKTLSGGNIQKLIIARIFQNPNIKVIVAEEPTAGLDVKTTEFVHRKIVEASRQGVSFILISSELDELLKLSNRLAVIYDGRITKMYNHMNNIDINELSKCMMGLYN